MAIVSFCFKHKIDAQEMPLDKMLFTAKHCLDCLALNFALGIDLWNPTDTE